MRNLNAIIVIESWAGRSQVVALHAQSKVDIVTVMNSRVTECWLVGHVVSRSEIAKKKKSLLNSQLIYINRKVLGQVNKCLI